MIVEPGDDGLFKIPKVLCAGERNGKDAVDEDELWGVFGLDLDADVEEADAVEELVARGDGLAAHGGEGIVVRGAVVGAGHAESGEGRCVVEVLHPLVKVGAVEDADEGVAGKVDAREVEIWVWS